VRLTVGEYFVSVRGTPPLPSRLWAHRLSDFLRGVSHDEGEFVGGGDIEAEGIRIIGGGVLPALSRVGGPDAYGNPGLPPLFRLRQ
jgi:hypothetical protein